jgi:aerobic carbon-monoxide dehydrogenase large subunit
MNDAIDIVALQSLGAIGQPLRRKEDQRLLTGRGRFSDDFTLPGSYARHTRTPGSSGSA